MKYGEYKLLEWPWEKKPPLDSRMALGRWNSWSCDVESRSGTPAETYRSLGRWGRGPAPWILWTAGSCRWTWAWRSPSCRAPRAWTGQPSTGKGTAHPSCSPACNPGVWASCPSTRSWACRRWRPGRREPRPGAPTATPRSSVRTWSSHLRYGFLPPSRLPRGIKRYIILYDGDVIIIHYCSYRGTIRRGIPTTVIVTVEKLCRVVFICCDDCYDDHKSRCLDCSCSRPELVADPQLLPAYTTMPCNNMWFLFSLHDRGTY